MLPIIRPVADRYFLGVLEKGTTIAACDIVNGIV